MNSKLKIIVTLSLAFVMIITGISPVTTAFAEDNYKHEDIHDFIQEGQSVISQETITDFAGNTFKLYELSPSGYAIYSFNENASIFIEGSYITNSPYYGESGTKYYCGIGEYFIEPVTRSANGNVRHLRTDESIPKTNLTGAAFTVDAEHYIKPVQTRASNPSTPDPNKTVTSSNGFTYIKDFIAIAMMDDFPTNNYGTCGLVSLCIILGYYDRIVDNDIITDSSFVVTDSSGYTDGVTQAFHDYLFAYCQHTWAGVGIPTVAYPMTASEILLTVQDYVNYKCSTAVKSRIHHSVGLTNVESYAETVINGGNPVILTLLSFDYQEGTNSDSSSFHNVVAYGYDSNDRFYVHMGYQKKSSSTNPYQFAQVIISDASFHSAYTLNHDWA